MLIWVLKQEDEYLGVRFLGRIRKWICDLRSFRSCLITGTDESTLEKDSSVPLMWHDPNDLRSLIHFRILPKKRTLDQPSIVGILLTKIILNYQLRTFLFEPTIIQMAVVTVQYM